MNYGKAKTILEECHPFKKAFDMAINVECYQVDKDKHGNPFHSDALRNYMPWDSLIKTDNIVVDWELMDEQRYNETIDANTSSEFLEIYDKNNLVLVVLYDTEEE